MSGLAMHMSSWENHGRRLAVQRREVQAYPPMPGMRRGTATFRRYWELMMSAAIMGKPSSGQFATPLQHNITQGTYLLEEATIRGIRGFDVAQWLR